MEENLTESLTGKTPEVFEAKLLGSCKRQARRAEILVAETKGRMA